MGKRQQMTALAFETLFDTEALDRLFPRSRADRFFEALLGDANEGAYDIALVFKKAETNQLFFEFQLGQRPGKCLRCNLTHGLPDVFKRHPVIGLKQVMAGIQNRLDGRWRCTQWTIGQTREVSRSLHVIPLTVAIEDVGT